MLNVIGIVRCPVATPTAQSVDTSGTAAVACPVAPGGKAAIKATTKIHIRFGGSTVGACTTSFWYLTPDVDYSFDVPQGVTHFRAIAATATGTVFIVEV